jgi:hypothetical protein
MPVGVSLAVVGILLAVIALRTKSARTRGYSLGTQTIVRCHQGHLFTTIWIPGASFKSVRFGLTRFQRCPVGKHWTSVKPVKDADLTDADREVAARTRDVRVP